MMSRRFGITGGILSIVEITKSMKPSLHNMAFESIKSSQLRLARLKTEFRITGCVLLDSPPQDTEIQGQKSIVLTCVNIDTNSSKDIVPVILKVNYLNYPLEFLGRIVSPLKFYGEMIPIPIQILGRTYEKSLLARAVGYVAE